MSMITEIFLPNFHYGEYMDDEHVRIEVSDGSFMMDWEKQTLYWKYDPEYMGFIVDDCVLHSLRVYVPELKRKSSIRWDIIAAVCVGLLAMFMVFFWY